MGLEKKGNLIIANPRLKITPVKNSSNFVKKIQTIPKISNEMKSSINSLNSINSIQQKKKTFKIETSNDPSLKIKQKNSYSISNANTRYSTKNTDNSNSAIPQSPISKEEFFFQNLIDKINQNKFFFYLLHYYYCIQ